jgi:diacylglycerol kinase family enzyme
MRALLVVNHKATTTSGRVRDVLVQALRSEVELEVAYTKERNHAASLAERARADGVDVVVALGGDGTVNEIVNGLLAGRRPGTPVVDQTPVPALAVVPGGSTNVFARAIGLPPDWVEATGVLLEALRAGRSRAIGLGLADNRYFTFCAGFGLDADVVRRVEQFRQRGDAATPALYLRALTQQYLADTRRRRTRTIVLERPDQPPEQLASAIVQNTTPWTYLGRRAINACPDASFDLGLDLLGLRGLRSPGTARTMGQLLFGRQGPGAPGPHGKQVLRLHDTAEFTLRGTEPFAFQLDGDYLGERENVRFVAAAQALRVIC